MKAEENDVNVAWCLAKKIKCKSLKYFNTL